MEDGVVRLLGPRPADVIEVVSEMTGVSVDELVGDWRSRAVTPARFVAYWCCRLCCDNASWPYIAAAFGRDHTTVLAGTQRVNDNPTLLAVARQIAAEVDRRYPAPSLSNQAVTKEGA